jgi:acetamidase/formamidase
MMRRLTKDHLFCNYCYTNDAGIDVLRPIPTPPLTAAQGESFLIDTVDTGNRNVVVESDKDKPSGEISGNPSTGPVAVEGILAGEVIAVTIEDLQVTDSCFIDIDQDSFYQLSS